MSDVNKQLLDAVKALVSALNDAMPHMDTRHDGVGPDCTKQFQALIDGRQAIAAAEQEQQGDIGKAISHHAKPVAWQFYQDGKWWNGYDRIKNYRKNTEDAGIPTRDLYAQPPAVAVPDGYALVLIEPTPEMVAAGAEGDSQFYDHAQFVYRAMLDAAPKP